MSRKIERLINLTIALLATKRYLTKSEIFRTVEGYEGSPEAKERMFERDKDDLRSLGITIDVGSFDPLFSDEAGYRITSEKYQLNLEDISPSQMSLLSLAAQAWQGAAFADTAQSAILKLSSIGIPSDPIEIPGMSLKLSDDSADLETIITAIAATDFLVFDYLSQDMKAEERTIIPFAVSNRSGYWYISGVDQSVQEVRTFRLDRVQGSIHAKTNQEDFEFPVDYESSPSVVGTSQIATIDIRKGKCQNLRSLATSTQDLGEWDRIKVPIFTIESLASKILWHGVDAFVQEPTELREHLVNQLQALVSDHE